MPFADDQLWMIGPSVGLGFEQRERPGVEVAAHEVIRDPAVAGAIDQRDRLLKKSDK